MVMSAETQVASHPIFNTDPAEQVRYVYRELCVTTKDGNGYSGRCYTIDPVSQSVVLVRFTENGRVEKIRIIMGHSIQKVTVLDEDTEKYKVTLDGLFRNNGISADMALTPAELDEKKEHLRLWLSKNRIPVQVCEDNAKVLSISDALFIEPPYNSENCRSTNEIILGRVQGLIKSMPADQSQW